MDIYLVEVEHRVRSLLKVSTESADKAAEMMACPENWPLPVLPPIGVMGSSKVVNITKI